MDKIYQWDCLKICLEICLVHFLQLLKFKSQANSSPYRCIIEPMNKRHCEDCIEIYFTALILLSWTPVSNPDDFSVGSLYRTSRYNYTSAIQSSSQNHSFNRSFADDDITDEYRILLRCCSQTVTRNRAAGIRKPSQEINQVPFLYYTIYGIRIIRDRLFGASNRDYMWTEDWL